MCVCVKRKGQEKSVLFMGLLGSELVFMGGDHLGRENSQVRLSHYWSGIQPYRSLLQAPVPSLLNTDGLVETSLTFTLLSTF